MCVIQYSPTDLQEIENASKEVPKTFLEMLPTIECISPEQHLKATKCTYFMMSSFLISYVHDYVRRNIC